MPNEQKNINSDRSFEQKKFNPNSSYKNDQTDQGVKEKTPPLTQNYNPSQKPLVDLQVYEPTKPKPKRNVNPALYMPINTQHPFMPPQYQMPGSMVYGPPNQMPIIKNYSINVSGPIADHGRVNAIYEDILPTKQFAGTLNTLGERLNIDHFVRSVFIKQYDGEDIDLEGSGENSILSYLKFMELNPYNTNHFTDNPYKSLPDDMLIYRSCYPIRFDRKEHAIQCAKNSIGMNIRIYRLTENEYNAKRENVKNYSDYEVWRELMFYQYIKEQILKENICPNFPLLYTFHICENCNIDFDKIIKIKGKYREHVSKYTKDVLNPQFPNQQQLDSKVIFNNVHARTTEPSYLKKNDQIITVNNNGEAYSGKGLIGLTEAPNYSIYAWASRTYKQDGNIRTMVNTGFHKPDVWESILFQLMSALYVLQIHGIAFNDFDLENNVYIKDLTTHGNITKYWKYIINGFEYYIPNHGYLLMIDSNFRDINKSQMLIKPSGNKHHKIYSNIFANDNETYSSQDIKKLTFNMFKKCFNPNSFSTSFVNIGGSKPPDSIKNLFTEIHRHAVSNNSHDIGYYIHTYMRKFMNNRVGTFLKDTEINNVMDNNLANIKNGQMISYQVHNETYKFGIFMGQDKTQGRVRILTRKEPKNPIIIEKSIPSGLLREYSRYDDILQNFKPGESNLNEDDLLETYSINKNNT